MKIYIRTRTEEQSMAVHEALKRGLLKNAEELTVMLHLKTSGETAAKLKKCNALILADLPAIARENRMDDIKQAMKDASWAEGYVIRNVDELGFSYPEGKTLIADSFLYAYNTEAIAFYKEIFPGLMFCASDELNDGELKGLKNAKNIIYKIYGRQSVMFTAQSMDGNYEGKRGEVLSLESVKKDTFEAADEEFGYTCIYTAKPVSMLDKADEIHMDRIMADFTLESEDETKEVIECLEAVIEGKSADLQKEFIRGHHYKGID